MTLTTPPQAATREANTPPYTICVVGLGKIGLALAAQYVSRGQRVLGYDIDADLVRTVNQGAVPPFSEEGLAERVAQGVEAGLLSATTTPAAAIAPADVVVVVVPLVVDRQGTPDFRALDSATSAIAASLKPGALVVYETTLPLGTTRERFGPMLAASRRVVGTDFYLAFSPERVLVGRTFEDLRAYPKVVGGVTAESTRRAVAFYRSVLDADILEMPDAETAEFVKLAETTYRDVNIGLANELARFAQARGVDALAAFKAANTQRFSHLHTPGVGVGGHCIPVYPRFLVHQAGEDELQLVKQARRANDAMAEYACDLLAGRLGSLQGKRVLILGLAYRGGVKEPSFSSALLLREALAARGASVLLNDPLFSDAEIRVHGFEPTHLDAPLDVDGVVLQAEHDCYRTLPWQYLPNCRIVVDGRHFLNPEPIIRQAMAYVRIGGGQSANGQGAGQPKENGHGSGQQKEQVLNA